MKKILIFVFIVQLLFACAKPSVENEKKDRNAITDLTALKRAVDTGLIFIDMNGNEIKLAQFKGKVLLLNFWTSWVVTVPEELKKLNQLNKEITDTDFKLISVSLDEPYSSDFRNFIAAQPMQFDIFVSANNQALNKCFTEISQKIPCFYIINKDFEIVKHFIDPLDLNETIKVIKEYLND